MKNSEGEEFPPVESLIPHRGPARLLQRIAERTDDGLVALAAVPTDSPLAASGLVPAFVTLEMAAQAAAALAALARERPGAPREGYLVGARNATFHRLSLPAGEVVRIAIQPAGTAGPLAVYDFTAHLGDTLLASGTISTYRL